MLRPNYMNGDNHNPHVKILDSSVKVFNRALEIAKSEIATKSMNDADGSAVKTCKEMYDHAIEELNKTMEAVNSEDKFGANIRFSAILSYIETCEDGLHGRSENSSLASANKMLSKLASNSLALSNYALGVNDD
ncbi:hypothetical protein Dimus_032501 [Dionaea muscipula]